MLNEKLAEASKEVTFQRRRYFFIGAAAVGAGVIALVCLSFVDFSIRLDPSSTPAQVRTIPPRPSLSTAMEETADKASRERFKERLRHFEEGAESLLATANLKAWNPKARGDITSLKGQALSAFSKSDYGSALKSLAQTQLLAENILSEWEDNFQEFFSQALVFFNQNSYDKAKLKIEDALALKPDDGEALELKKRIDSLLPIVKLLEEAKVAQLENDLQKEFALLSRVVELDPARVELLIDLENLKRQLMDIRFSSLIDKGLGHVNAGRLHEARSSLAEARKIYPARSEVNLLAANIDAFSKGLLLEQALDKSQSAIVKDDWKTVLSVAEKGLKVHPENRTLLDRINMAERIILTRKAIQDFIKYHQRLSSKNVTKRAQQILNEAENLSNQSFSLLSNMHQLEKLLEAYGRSIDVFLKSDNQTYIVVRGVGQVGITAGRSIKLKPGEYIFEGKREGFRSKLVTVQIPINNLPVTVEIVCDEPI
ncbi:MAG: hypothetical protein V7731_05770 [Amphritea sp.]